MRYDIFFKGIYSYTRRYLLHKIYCIFLPYLPYIVYFFLFCPALFMSSYTRCYLLQQLLLTAYLFCPALFISSYTRCYSLQQLLLTAYSRTWMRYLQSRRARPGLSASPCTLTPQVSKRAQRSRVWGFVSWGFVWV